MNAKILRASMIAAAVAVSLLALLVYAYFTQASTENYYRLREQNNPAQDVEFWGFLFNLIFVVPSLLVLVGTYAHVVRRRHWGIVLVWVIGFLNELIIVVTFPRVAYVFQTPEERWIVGIVALNFILMIIVLALSLALAFAQRYAPKQLVGPEGGSANTVMSNE